MTNEQKSGARTALALLLAINLFNYIDRYVLAVGVADAQARNFWQAIQTKTAKPAFGQRRF